MKAGLALNTLSLRIARLLIVLFAVAVWTGTAHAQDSAIAQAQSSKIETIAAEIDSLAKSVDAIASDDAKLVEMRIKAEQAERDLLTASLAFQPRLSEIGTRLDQLGAPPAEGQPAEPDVVTAERNRLLGEKAELNALIGKAESATIAANTLVGQINDLRRDLFARALYTRTPLSLESLSEAGHAFGEEIGRFNRTVSSWWNFNARYKYASLLTMTAACLCVILLVYSLGRRLFRRMIFRDPSIEQPTYLARLSTGIWLVLITTVSIIVFVFVSLIAFSASGLLNEKMLSLFEGSFSLILIVMLVKALTDAILSPKNTAWSLLPIAAAPARRIQWLIIGIAFFAGLDFWLNAISEQLDSPVSVSVLKAIFATVVVGILITLLGRVKPFRDEDGNATAWPAWFRYTLFSLGIIPIAAVGLGYVGFARFVLEQIVVTGAVLVTMYLGFQSSHALSQEDAFAKTSLGKRLAGTGRFDDATLDQLSIAFGLLVNFLVVLIGIPLVLMQWGFQFQDILHWGYRLATEIRIGSVSFSLVGVLTGILVFIIAYFATRWFQGWLDNSVLKRGRFDSGVRNSIRTAVGYLGIAIAILIGISVAGIDLSNLALVAGALSLGIGFGLQNIVSNFVSGLILLAERPFKVGDWIEAGGHMGLVKRISVRATEIETFQRQTIILPNSELINSAVGNRTHRNHLGRVDIAVGVSYDCDPAFVRDLLLDIARENKMVLRNPEPQVFFANFGASSLDFELRVHVADIFTTAVVQTELRIEIFQQLKAAGIEIPFPQQDIHIKSGAPEDVRRFVDRMRPEGSDVKSDGEGEAATPAEPEPAAKPARRRNPRKAE